MVLVNPEHTCEEECICEVGLDKSSKLYSSAWSYYFLGSLTPNSLVCISQGFLENRVSRRGKGRRGEERRLGERGREREKSHSDI